MIEYTVQVHDNVTIWKLNNRRHREDGPAVEYINGDKFWFINGKLHREDGPAIERYDGTKVWFINGKRHREDGPALEYANGDKLWFINDKRHREDKSPWIGGEYGPIKIRSDSGFDFDIKILDDNYINNWYNYHDMTIEEIEEKLGHKVKIIKE